MTKALVLIGLLAIALGAVDVGVTAPIPRGAITKADPRDKPLDPIVLFRSAYTGECGAISRSTVNAPRDAHRRDTKRLQRREQSQMACNTVWSN